MFKIKTNTKYIEKKKENYENKYTKKEKNYKNIHSDIYEYTYVQNIYPHSNMKIYLSQTTVISSLIPSLIQKSYSKNKVLI